MSTRRDVRLEPAAAARLVRVDHSGVDHSGLAGTRAVLKAVLDRVVAAVLLVALLPLLVAVAALVRLTSPGPALFRQRRVGRHGRPFTILKFRTMDRDAPARLPSLRHRNVREGQLFKVPDDPRVTPVGRVLRRTSIDELPQLWNVLRGEMSLVGPRPLPVPPDNFTPRERRRHAVRPGMTGLWQVSGRSSLSWEETVRLDLRYVDNWSLALDLLILLRTPAALLRASGAH